MRPIIVYAFMLAALLTACEKRSAIEIPYEGDKIVVNSFIQPDSVVYVRVTLSEPVNSDNGLSFRELPNAQVSLLENGTPIGPLDLQKINGRHYFVSRTPARAGQRYTVTAAAPGLDPVKGSDTIPGQPDISGVFARQTGNRVYFMLKDDPGVANYYRIRVYKADSLNGKVQPIQSDSARIAFRLDPSFNDSFIDIISNAYHPDIVINDERVAGKTIQFVLQTEQEISCKYIMVEVSGLTAGGFKYLQTIDQNEDDGVSLGQLPQLYSNIENGYGIVAGIHARRISTKVQ